MMLVLKLQCLVLIEQPGGIMQTVQILSLSFYPGNSVSFLVSSTQSFRVNTS